MENPFQSDHFKKLQKKWYEKLEKAGFEDIERSDHETPFLHVWHSTHFFKTYSVEEVQEREAYYRMTREFYWSYADFKNKTEKEIWRLYTEGLSRRQIADRLERQRYSEGSIQIILSRLKKVMQTLSWPSKAEGIKRSDHSKKEPYHLSGVYHRR